MVDQSYRLSREEREAMWQAAHIKTIRELVRRLQWPVGVPVPNLNP